MTKTYELAEKLKKEALKTVLYPEEAISAALANAGDIYFQHPSMLPIHKPASEGDWSLLRSYRKKQRGK